MNISPKRADLMQLRALSIALRTSRATPRKMRSVFADALDRYLADAYPQPNGRPTTKERNAWLAVDYLIRCAQAEASQKKFLFKTIAGNLAAECAKYRIKITAITIAKLPTQHPHAQHVAEQLIESAKMFRRFPRDAYAEAIREASWHWQRAELD